MWQIKRRYTLMAFASLKPDYFVQLPYQTTDRMAVIMKETNFNYSNSFGLQASAIFNAGQWLKGQLPGPLSRDIIEIPTNRHGQRPAAGCFIKDKDIAVRIFQEMGFQCIQQNRLACTGRPTDHRMPHVTDMQGQPKRRVPGRIRIEQYRPL